MNFLNKVIYFFAIIFFILSLSSCKKTDTKNNIVSDNDKLSIFFKEHAKIDSNSYYDISYIKPNNKLYTPILAIQRKRWDIAIPLLEKLVANDAPNPDAMYWLASISGGSILSGSKMASLYEKSANLGNPYAALRLDSGSEGCDLYLTGYCNSSWGVKAREMLMARAKNGDYKARYQLAVLKAEGYQITLDLVLKNAENNYFYPLYNYLDFNNEINPDVKKKAYHYMAERGFTPVGRLMLLNYTNDSFDSEYYGSIFSMLENYGGATWSSMYGLNSKLFKSKPKKEYLKNVLLADFILRIHKNSKGLYEGIGEENIKNNIVNYLNIKLKNKGLEIMNQSEVELIKKKALSLAKNVKPIIYIDEFYYHPERN